MEIGFYPEQLWIAIPLFIISIIGLIASGKFKRKRQFNLKIQIMDIENEFKELKELIQDVYEKMDSYVIIEALTKLEKIRKEVVGN